VKDGLLDRKPKAEVEFRLEETNARRMAGGGRARGLSTETIHHGHEAVSRLRAVREPQTLWKDEAIRREPCDLQCRDGAERHVLTPR
jgi:hypothetical protein